MESPRPTLALVYRDEGADPFVTTCLIDALRPFFGAVSTISARTLLDDEGALSRAALFALPGGADRPYAEKLNGLGNQRIRQFVEAGGRLLAICAGAYYACRRIDFVGADFAVRADRELALFPGTAVGSMPELAGPYRVQDLRCAAATPVVFGDGEVADLLYWGGCRFVADDGEAGEAVIARYADLPSPDNVAAVRCQVGRGTAVLVGVHVEAPGDRFDSERRTGGYPSPDAPGVTATVDRLRASEEQRQALWREIMMHLGYPER